MAKNRKTARRAKRPSPALSLAELRSLVRLRKEADAAYNGFWLAAAIYKPPPKPPGFKLVITSLVRQLGAFEKKMRLVSRK